MKTVKLNSVPEYLNLTFAEIKAIGTIKLPLKVLWSAGLDSVTVFKINENLYIAFNYNVKSLVNEVNDLFEYYIRLFAMVERWRNENFTYKVTGLKIKNWENFNTQNLNKGFSVVFKVLKLEDNVGVTINQYLGILKNYHIEINSNLDSQNLKNTLQTLFKFEDKIKYSCEQYLLYFAQFLQDLGINATSEIKEEAGKVLFSVTPTDDVEALDKIREALAVYLNLPSSPIVYDDSFAAMRLQQQIENLKHSQKMAVREIQVNEKLLLAQSDMIREKNLTISQQQSVIEQKDKIIERISSKSIMMDSAENKEELEEIYDGLKIGKSESLTKWLGVHLNPAKVIKTAVTNTFGKDEIISILDSETDDK